jgi:hypothetical protein
MPPSGGLLTRTRRWGPIGGTNHRRLPTLPGDSVPSAAKSTAIGIRDTYTLARSSGVGMRMAHSLFVSSRPARSIDRPRSFPAPRIRCATANVMIFPLQEVRSARQDTECTQASTALTKPRIRPWDSEIQKGASAERNAGTGSEQDGFRMGTIAGTHLALTSSRPGHTRVSSHPPTRERYECRANSPPTAPLSLELRHCTAYLEHLQKPLGLNPWVREELS